MLKMSLRIAAFLSLLILLSAAVDGRFTSARQLLPGDECTDVTELPADYPISERELPLVERTVRVTERVDGTRWVREYLDENGSCLTMLRQQCDAETSTYELRRETLPRGTVLRLRDRATGNWTENRLSPGTYDANTVVLEMPSGKTEFYCLPLTFQEMEYSVLRHRPALAGKLIVTEVPGGFAVSVVGFGDAESSFVDFCMLVSPVRTLYWNVDNWAKQWDRFTNDGESLMSFSGYLRLTPGNYKPSGENCYYPCSAAFLARATRSQFGMSSTAALVTAAILDVSLQMQNAFGYFPTVPESEWLSGDYGIGHGFYDTRFNTDFLELLLYTRTNCGSKLFRQQLERYAAFFLSFAEEHHTETQNGGWLVADYWSQDMLEEPHTSLNHLVAECQQLFRLEDNTGDARFGELADRMLLALDDTCTDWVKGNHDLHYCRYADGSYGAQDYPALTYNDLRLLRQYLQKLRGRSSPTLDFLIEEKGKWMDANGVPR